MASLSATDRIRRLQRVAERLADRISREEDRADCIRAGDELFAALACAVILADYLGEAARLAEDHQAKEAQRNA